MRRPTGRSRRFPARGVASAPAPFTPADVAGLEAWYRETYAAGTWADLSGHGRDLTQATVGSRPTQVARAGQAVLSFDGGDFVQGAFGATLPQPLTVYAVVEPSALDAQRYAYSGDDSTNNVAMHIDATPQWSVMSTTRRSAGTPTTAIHGTCFVANEASSMFCVDDMRTGQAVIAQNPGAVGLDGLTAGARFDANAMWLGYIWEILIYSGAHDAATRKLIGDYFTARYDGLTVTT